MKLKSFSIAFLTMIFLFFCCDQNQEKRKIKLADQHAEVKADKQLTSTIYLEPALRRAVAVMFFENKTGDQRLAWLQKGLTEMFIRSLSQSQNLSVLGSDRLYQIIERLGKSDSTLKIDVDMAAIVAKEANVEALLTGNITKNGDSLQITVNVHEAKDGQILKVESVEGQGLENLFSMVDDLTQKIKSELRVSLEKEHEKGIAELSTNSLEAWRYYTAGVDFLNKFLITDAKQNFEKAIATDSSFVASYLYLVPIQLNQGELEKSNRAFAKLKGLRDRASDKEKYQLDLLDAQMSRDFKRVMNLSQKWVEQYPNDREANLNLAGISFSLQKYDQASTYYQKVLSIDPYFKNAYNILGYIYANTGDYDKAQTTLAQYQKLAPDEPNPFDSMGEIYYYQGEFKKAEKQFKRALKINHNFVFSYHHLGETYLEKGDYKKALAAFEKSLEKSTDPSDIANSRTFIGVTQWRLGHLEEAQKNIEKSLDQLDNQYLALTWLYEILKDCQNDSATELAMNQRFDLICQSLETYPERIYRLASLSLWYDLNALKTIDIINEILPTTENPSAHLWGHFLLALLYIKTNQFDQFKNKSANFTDDLMERIKTGQDIPLTFSTLRNFSIFNLYAYHALEQGVNKYNQLINQCLENELKVTEMIFRCYLADLYFHTNNYNQGHAQLQVAGVPEESQWMVIGPFDHKNGFEKEFLPETKTEMDKSYQAKTGAVQWQHAKDGINEGYIDLQKLLKNYNWSVGYAWIYIKSLQTKNVQFRVGTNDATKIWLNENLVWKFNFGRDAIFDDDIFNITLKSGLNKILIKVCNRISLWGFYFRVTDAEGNGLPDIEFISPAAAK